MNWAPLHCHSQASLLDGLSKPAKIAERCASLGYTSCAITDHGNMGEIVHFSKECVKRNIKPILGCEFYLCEHDPTIRNKDNPISAHLCVLAKNKKGYSRLVKAVSESNRPENFYRKPRLQRNSFAEYSGDLIAFSGHPGSELFNVLWTDPRAIFKAPPDEITRYLDPNYKKNALRLIDEYREIFGPSNFFVEIQLVNNQDSPPALLAAEILRELCESYGYASVATGDSHYTTKDEAEDQRVLLCAKFETNFRSVKAKLDSNEDVTLGSFFKNNCFHIPSFEEIQELHSEREIAQTLEVANMCESYSIFNKPMLPQFDCDNPDEYLLQLCREGWNSFKHNVNPADYKTYGDRVKFELEVLRSFPVLINYFLIVQDYVNWYKNQGLMIGPGRGSAAGCLVSRLLGIISVDPIQYDLMFERFYNPGRNTEDRVSIPDIDVDFGRRERHKVLGYVNEKYGEQNVSQISTFGRMMGKEALKSVLRAHSACDFDTMNLMTKSIPDEAAIADDLNEAKDRGEDVSIILWTLQNESDNMSEWCTIADNGKLEGPFAQYFEQAIRLEGVKKTQSKHASGTIISPIDLSESVPMVLDKTNNELIAGLDMHGLEDMGFVKFDILGVSLIDKIMDI